MGYRNVPNVYKQNQILNATPKKLVIMLYEGAIKNLKLAELSAADKKIEATSNALIKAQEIIQELIVTLDFKNGGEVAENLNQLYDYFITELIKSNRSKDPESMKKIRESLEELRDTWLEI
ncbi:flagellar protein FliS [Carnobacterium iners]|uniref:Flagellar protein FliS n=1 Tax=Carnobacterium iners TaxID=1073423 RepID=A0A1X7N2D3_9LACT|nr:flagellar export chaperone FliS [Carnobacterium iners]SEK21635.1 flagellar protein FliS [Carnobacterium iners]SMH30599.1 flagellar protein FliS [Carnobacterium iners]